MLQVIKKTNCYNIKELDVLSAIGKLVNVEGKEIESVEAVDKIGEIKIDEYKNERLYSGKIVINALDSRIRFFTEQGADEERKKAINRIGILENSVTGEKKYQIMGKFFVKGSFLFLKSGYYYYELTDYVADTRYVIKDICFGSDMHYYYIYNEQERLVAAIYKPYRNPGKDEYYIYSKANDMAVLLDFVVSYIDYFMYAYNSASQMARNEHYSIHEDDAAYQVSEEDLLALYDESFLKEVILNE